MAPGSSSLISAASPASNSFLMTSVSDTDVPTNKNTREKKKEKSNRMVETMGGSKKGKNSPSGRASTGKKTSPKKFCSATCGAAKVLKEHKEKEYKEKEYNSTSESEPEENEVSFEDYSELCERVAKTMYYVNPRPNCTPRPSLPLTILAVDTFTKYARKDTLEFLDIDMAAEIGRNACVSPTALVFALVYLERLSINNPGYLKTVKPSELFVVSLLVASKFVQDDGEDMGIFNDEWATSANMELKRINQLELEFLTAIDWWVKVGKQEFDRAMQHLEGKVSMYQGVKRGWFTYTELKSLSDNHLWNAILPLLYEKIVQVVSGICVMYTTFFATLITSSVLAPYLLSVSKLVLVSSVTNSLLTGTGSSLSSCSTEDTLVNASIPLTSQDIHITTTNIIPHFPPRHHLVPAAAELLLASLEEQENQTESENLAEMWRKQEISLQHHHHHQQRVETGNANSGYSYKCESRYCREYSQEEALGKVQRVLENLLQSHQQQSNHYQLESTNQRFRCSVGGNALCAI